MIKVKVIADSIGPSGIRLTTIEATYPRMIHAELMTYRKFSRNAASSRAIPVKKQLKRIWENQAHPEHWGINKAGMQADAEATGFRLWLGKKLWKLAGVCALAFAWMLMKLQFHKQIVNRITEPWSHITVIITSDQIGYANMFAQRDHKDAQPEFRILARKIWAAYNCSRPTVLKIGDWHLPYIFIWDIAEVKRWFPDDEKQQIETLKKISVGRCARVSYLNHNGARHLNDDIALCVRLMSGKPGHWSPFEHVAMAIAVPANVGNVVGWRQWRKDFEEECISDLKPWVPEEYTKEVSEYYHEHARGVKLETS